MRKLLLLLIASLGIAAMLAPASGRAAAFHDGDYTSIGVSDLPQAVTFFRNVLDCQPINPAPVDAVAQDSRLLFCDAGQIVELNGRHAAASTAPALAANAGDAPIQFVTDDAASVGNWLRREGVQTVGAPHTLVSGPRTGWVAVDFVSPWGLHMQLVSWNADVMTVGL